MFFWLESPPSSLPRKRSPIGALDFTPSVDTPHRTPFVERELKYAYGPSPQPERKDKTIFANNALKDRQCLCISFPIIAAGNERSFRISFSVTRGDFEYRFSFPEDIPNTVFHPISHCKVSKGDPYLLPENDHSEPETTRGTRETF